MTAQVHDTVLYNDTSFCIVGIKGSGLFDPSNHGVRVSGASSACWRGFSCTYTILNGVLTLQKLEINPHQEDISILEKWAPRGAEQLEPQRPGICGDCRFEDLAIPVSYTGGLLLGDGFITAMYVHMGFHPPYKWERVFEVMFDLGRVVNVMDRSAEMEQVRQKLKNVALEPGHQATEAEIEAWIARCFSLDYT